MDNQAYLTSTLDAVYKKNLKNLIEVRKILIRSFGEQNIQMVPKDLTNLHIPRGTDYQQRIQAELNGEYYEIIIRFPEVELVSQTRQKHLIRDLFVRIHFNQNLNFTGAYEGLRTTHTEAEWVSDYSHSHLPCLSTVWNNFCVGTGPLATMIADMRRGEFNLDIFQMLCLNIKAYVAYESISGHPYRRISNIGGRDACPSNLLASFGTQLQYIYAQLLRTMDGDMIKTLFKPQFDGGVINIKITDDMEQGLATFIRRISGQSQLRPMQEAHLFSIKKSDGTYVNPTSASTRSISNFQPSLVLRFKKEDQMSKLIGSERNTVLFAHPEITQYVTKRISRKLTRAAITFNQAQQSSQTENIGATPERDPVSL